MYASMQCLAAFLKGRKFLNLTWGQDAISLSSRCTHSPNINQSWVGVARSPQSPSSLKDSTYLVHALLVLCPYSLLSLELLWSHAPGLILPIGHTNKNTDWLPAYYYFHCFPPSLQGLISLCNVAIRPMWITRLTSGARQWQSVILFFYNLITLWKI